MKAFAALYGELDATTSTRRKTDAMVRYFRNAPSADAAWAAYFLAGGRPGRPVATRELRQATLELTGLPEWLFDECYQAVGDLAETIALLLPEPSGADADPGLAEWMTERILPARALAPEAQRAAVTAWWRSGEPATCFVLNKLLTGGMRVGVSRLLVIRALAEAFERDPRRIAQRLMGYTDKKRRPDARAFERVVSPIGQDADEDALEAAARPYPFFLAQSLNGGPQALGPAHDWYAEWKWDGIRGQLIRRMGQTWIWSRGEELMNERFPEFMAMGDCLPEGTVLDGEVLCWLPDSDSPLPFARLQQRIGRKTLSARLLAEAPVVFMAYDLIEHAGLDIRQVSQQERRARLDSLVRQAGHAGLRLSGLVASSDWAALATRRAQARSRGVEGLMLKRRDAAYGTGRTRTGARGEWWKWKLDPMSVDCVLIYAQRGHGRRASLYTDYTFAVWNGPPEATDRKLVPFAKAYSGLTDDEFARVDAVIRRTVVEKFGPVRSVKPTLVFELGFEGIQASSRHRSGIAVRFPRMLRERTDKSVEEADTLEDLRRLLR